MSERIPIHRVAGSHREVGRQVGEATIEVIRRAVAFDDALPPGRSRAAQLALAAQLPRRDAGLHAVAGRGDRRRRRGGRRGPAGAVRRLGRGDLGRPSPQADRAEPVHGRCTDLVAGPPATADGHVWVAHTNDLSPAAEADLVAIEWRVPGEPVVLSLGTGPWISVGWNDAGLSLTGNELSPNDERVGVPRLLMVREQLTARSMDEAVAMALRSDRASSYNTVFAGRDGSVVDVEGSATDHELVSLDPAGHLVHANHYACARMRRYEGDPAYATRSAVRHARAAELLAAAPAGSITPDALRAMLADHATDPPICRHEAAEERSKTVFWCVADVTVGEIRFGRGNPCASEEQRYRFA